MKTFVNDQAINVVGSCKQGMVKTTYQALCEAFGEPTYVNGDKYTSEWSLQFFDGESADFVTATIYDWKYETTNFGEMEWTIGGFSMEAVFEVYEALGI